MVRQLTAIMFTDMVGYTALMQENERHAKDKRDRQRQVLQRSIPEHGGRILEVHGDGTLSIFPSAVQAVLSAVDIQTHLRQDPAVPLRIGVHSGDVIHDGDGVFGDGVNVAARIQGLSAPGAVLISAKVFDEVKNQPEIRTRSLGEFDLKNVQRPMEVYAVVNGGLAVPEMRDLASQRARECRSVAVLPFVNMSPDPENEFFSDGITEEIINALTRVNGLQVTARTSSFAYKNRNEDVREIAAQLGVNALLEGSVRKAGGRVRITAQLIDARDGYHLFSEVYDRALDDIFATQDELARTIVDQLEGRLLVECADDGSPQAEAVRRVLVHAHTHDTEAYTEYLKGLHRWRRFTPECVRAGIRHYERSVELDPDCALPHAGLANAFTYLGALGQMPPDEAYPRAKEAAHRALELEEGLGESHLSLAAVKLFYEWDFDGAYRSFQRALSLIPGSAEAHQLYALYLRIVGEIDAAVEEMETAVQLDPLSPPYNHSLGQVYFGAGRVEEAFAQVHRTLELDPDFRAALETLGWLHASTGDYEAALAAWERIVERTGDPFKVIPHRAYALARLQRFDEAHAMQTLLEGRAAEQPELALEIDFAVLHLALGDHDAVFDYLERARERRLGALVFMASGPIWNEIHDDPRFGELLERIGLPVPARA